MTWVLQCGPFFRIWSHFYSVTNFYRVTHFLKRLLHLTVGHIFPNVTQFSRLPTFFEMYSILHIMTNFPNVTYCLACDPFFVFFNSLTHSSKCDRFFIVLSFSNCNLLFRAWIILPNVTQFSTVWPIFEGVTSFYRVTHFGIFLIFLHKDTFLQMWPIFVWDFSHT